MDLGARFYELPGWAFLLTAIGVILGVLAIWLTRKTRLFFGMPTVTPLLNSPAVRERVVVSVVREDGTVDDLEYPHHVDVQLVTRGRRDIDASDFDRNMPLEFDVGARVSALLEPVRVEPTNAQTPHVSWDDKTLRIDSCLVRGRQLISLSLLVDGQAPRVTCPQPNLSNVVVKRFTGPEPPIGLWPQITVELGVVALSLVLIGSVLSKFVSRTQDEPWLHALQKVNGWLIVLWLASWVITAVLRRLARRR
ncbi:hypothetical protein [Streptomyces marianii]|uniref:Uncharacterized protein n=1 Tax=Streptomyces marianii TaxID=1817406 RepID=A0A5R9DTG3_9ACTN|nr:hypothetical protein [Streptomyces marianii]TLQ38973.1 hypothetical protein FEF34_39850 [Streptomyces marianii]